MYLDNEYDYINYVNLEELDQDRDLDIDKSKNRILINLYFLFFFLMIMFIYINYVDILEDNVRMLTRKIKRLKRNKNKWTLKYVGSSESDFSSEDDSRDSDCEEDSSGSEDDSSDSDSNDSSGSSEDDSSDGGSKDETELDSSDDDVYNFRTFNRSKSIGELSENNKLNRVYTRSMSELIKKRN